MLKIAIIPVTMLQQNCSILFDDDSKIGVVVDPGGNVPELLAAIKELGITIEAIWLTHGHFDHVGGAQKLKEALQVNIIGPHKDDAYFTSNVQVSAAKWGLEEELENCEPDRWLNEGETLSLSNHDFEVFHCPGHSPGHVIFVNRAQNITIMGDVLFNGSIGRTDLPHGNHEQLLSSIKDKVLPLGDDMNFICGHGPASNIGHEKQNNPYLQGM